MPSDPDVDVDRVRDHLANERTFLAWLRTALAVLALGALLLRVPDDRGTTTVAAAAVVLAAGALILSYGTARYYAVARDLAAGRFRVAGRSPALVTGMVLALTILVVVLLVI